MENWYLIAIELIILVFFGGLFYLIQKRRIINRAKANILLDLQDFQELLVTKEEKTEFSQAVNRGDLYQVKVLLEKNQQNLNPENLKFKNYLLNQLTYLTKK